MSRTRCAAPQVYRLLVAKTYEMHMFKTASKKLGLDQAVLSGSRPQKKQDAAPTKKEVRGCRREENLKIQGGGGGGLDLGRCCS